MFCTIIDGNEYPAVVGYSLRHHHKDIVACSQETVALALGNAKVLIQGKGLLCLHAIPCRGTEMIPSLTIYVSQLNFLNRSRCHLWSDGEAHSRTDMLEVDMTNGIVSSYFMFVGTDEQVALVLCIFRNLMMKPRSTGLGTWRKRHALCVIGGIGKECEVATTAWPIFCRAPVIGTAYFFVIDIRGIWASVGRPGIKWIIAKRNESEWIVEIRDTVNAAATRRRTIRLNSQNSLFTWFQILLYNLFLGKSNMHRSCRSRHFYVMCPVVVGLTSTGFVNVLHFNNSHGKRNVAVAYNLVTRRKEVVFSTTK